MGTREDARTTLLNLSLARAVIHPKDHDALLDAAGFESVAEAREWVRETIGNQEPMTIERED